ncbi:MAG TPA: metallophosphoesterase, partial [Candidatus Angelobacter sp.]|nr:metallophosphoesterase [Candidatus Angelobacter sp.]
MKFPHACAGTQGRQRPLLPIAVLIFFLAVCWAIQPMASAQVNPPDFTVVVFPDPQNETQYFPQVLNSQTQWIVNNRQALNIQMVMTEGDNVNDGASTAQLQNLDAAFRLLDNAGIPYLLGVGNHDYNGFTPKISRNLSGFNQWFGPGRFAGKAYFKGNFPAGSNANSYAVLTINGQQYLFLTLEYRPTSASLDWAESILAANPDNEVIVVDHSFVLKNNTREDLCDDQDMPASNATGQAVWMRLRKYNNVIMFLSGHFTGGSGARRADLGDNGNLLNQL